jgi:hypothetical protein
MGDLHIVLEQLGVVVIRYSAPRRSTVTASGFPGYHCHIIDATGGFLGELPRCVHHDGALVEGGAGYTSAGLAVELTHVLRELIGNVLTQLDSAQMCLSANVFHGREIVRVLGLLLAVLGIGVLVADEFCAVPAEPVVAVRSLVLVFHAKYVTELMCKVSDVESVTHSLVDIQDHSMPSGTVIEFFGYEAKGGGVAGIKWIQIDRERLEWKTLLPYILVRAALRELLMFLEAGKAVTGVRAMCAKLVGSKKHVQSVKSSRG